MALILIIDTAIEQASIALCKNNEAIALEINTVQNEHASFVQPAIAKIVMQTNISLNEIDAIAVVNGPGSYTGLRVGLSSAKGLCFALNKPLITLNTLEVMALATINTYKDPTLLHCPMIDARRMEVYTALYNHKLEVLEGPTATILEENNFKISLKSNKIVFSGNGSIKAKSVIVDENAIFAETVYNATSANTLAQLKFVNNAFDNVAYTTPNYLKEFYTTAKIVRHT